MNGAAAGPGNILLVANFPSDVGFAWWLMENFWAEIAVHFAASGSKSILVFPQVRRVSERIARAPIEIRELDYADRSPANLRRLERLIREERVRVVYLTDGRYLDSLYARMRAWGVRRIINHDHTPGERPPATPLRCMLKRLAHWSRLPACDHYIAVSRFVFERLLGPGCIPRKRCSVVMNGIVPIEREARCVEHARIAFGVPKDAKLVVTTGRASYYKGVDFLIECAATIVNERRREDAFFLHCGDGPDQEVFRTLAAERGIQGRFLFGGRRDDIPCILQGCDLAVQASKGEAFSLSILEYMSAGLATIAPDVCGNGEAIESGRNGLLYPPGDSRTLVAMIEQLLDDPEQRARLGAAAAGTVRERFTLDRANRELLATLEGALGVAGGPQPPAAAHGRPQ
jgi:glycosyltransferase involved in cell wall biosynthesis